MKRSLLRYSQPERAQEQSWHACQGAEPEPLVALADCSWQRRSFPRVSEQALHWREDETQQDAWPRNPR
jgi:hypothetical protein